MSVFPEPQNRRTGKRIRLAFNMQCRQRLMVIEFKVTLPE